MKKHFSKRLLALVLAVVMCFCLALPASAAENNSGSSVTVEKVDNSLVSASIPGREAVEIPENENPYKDSDLVRVSIILETAGTIQAGYSPDDIATNDAAMNYRDTVVSEQMSMTGIIENTIGEDLDVVWNLTLAANIISANVEYGQIEAIEAIDGIDCVVIETRYETDLYSTGAADPNMATSGKQIGSAAAWAAGYTGAGSRIAIIDTGLDIDHEAFNAGAFEYSLGEDIDGLDLLDAEFIANVVDELNAYIDLSQVYISSKIPFGYNYVDQNHNVTHLYDSQGEHGSHVAGIAAANKYVPAGDGYEAALESTYVQGVAPDAQLIIMKVFGAGGGAYDSDYMAAIEDAIILGADAVNLSLGSGNPGMSRNSNAEYQAILDSLVKSGVVVAMSAGNSGSWADYAEHGVPYLYADDVSMQTDGSPGSFTNSLAVASVNNDGTTGLYVTVDGSMVLYAETEYTNAPMTSLAGEQEFVFINGIGTPEQFAQVDVTGKIALCYRGETSFFEKAEAAVEAGAIAAIIVNNQAGIINMDLSDYSYTAPVVSILQADGELFKLGEVQTTEGGLEYWTGTMTVAEGLGTGQYNSNYYTMSSFSSWGVPGSLELKPEIVAPGGMIYSVNGDHPANSAAQDPGASGHNKYEQMSGTSMASPQVAGMAAVVAQYIRENDLCAKTGLDARTLAQSLLMSTAVPMYDADGYYYSLMQQGAGLANVGAAVSADSYILMGADATSSYADGKVKAELGDDPDRSGVYTFSFTINNLEDEDKDFLLSAEAFMQYPVSGLMHTSTDYVPCTATWTSSGKLSTDDHSSFIELYDINGDGIVNDADGQMILDYTTGLVEEISELADIDGDEDVDTYDAYLFFNLKPDTYVTVPANGSVTIQVTLDVRAYAGVFDYYFPNGTYVQAYVYAESFSTEEGVEGTSHSIPVLGFYGSWTEASMYDKGSYVEFAHGIEKRAPYLYKTNYANGNYNGLLVKYHDDSNLYYFGGNPQVFDAEYMPERNAINSENGDVIAKIGFTAIRNAAESAFIVRDPESGGYYIAEGLGDLDSAYYHVNGGSWENTYYTVSTNFTPYGLPEGTTIDVGLVLVPEYYTLDGSLDLSKLGDGAFLTMPMTIDNTAPVIDEASVAIDAEAKTLTVNISDNEYVAAVALYDIYGQYLYTYVGSNAEAAAGEAYDFVLSLDGVNGPRFLLQVYDYANNTSTYMITTQIGEVTEEISYVEISKDEMVMQKGNIGYLSAVVYPVNAVNREVVWSSSDESVATVDENGVVTAVSVGVATITATAAADDTKSASCEVEVIDINTNLNGIVWDEEGSIWFSEFNTTELPNYSKLSIDMLDQDYFVAATTGPDGTLYASTLNTSNGTGALYTINTETWEATKLSDCTVQGLHIFYSDLTYVPAMFGTGALLGSYGPYVIAIDPATGTALGIIDSYDDVGDDIVGITACYGVYDPESGVYQDVVYVILNNGTVVQEIYYGYNSAVVPMMSYFYGFRAAFDCGYDVGSSWYFNSAYYDGTYLYWSAFDRAANDNDVELLAIDADYSEAVYSLGTFAEGVWPVGGLYQAPAASTGEGSTGIDADELEQLRDMIAEKGAPEYTLVKREVSANSSRAAGSLNSTIESGYTNSELENGDVVVNITAMGAEGVEVETSTNGLVTVTYDPELMTLVSSRINGDYTSVNIEEGKITFAYVSLDGISDLATLTFSTEEVYADLTVTHSEVNDSAPAYEEELHVKANPLLLHPSEPSKPEQPDKPDEPDTPDQPDVPDVPAMDFEDVTEKDWFYEDVKYAFENGLMQGVSDTQFNPYGDMSRAMVVTVLYRMDGKPAVSGSNSFTDLTQDWYKDAVQWAVANGITKGISDTEFAPNAKVTREQLVTFLYRYAAYKGIDVSSGEGVDLTVFKDYTSVSTYAVSAIQWAVAEGIIQGSNVGLEPGAGANRAQAAAILHRFLAE